MTIQNISSRDFQENFDLITDRVVSGEIFRVTHHDDKAVFLINAQNLRECLSSRFVSWLDGRAKTAPDIALNISEDDLDTIINKELAK